MKRNSLFFSIILCVIIFFCGCQKKRKFEDTSLTFEERVDALLNEMTLNEKINQLKYNAPAIPRLNISEYNWWNEALHGVGRSGIATVFPQAIGMAAMWDDSSLFKVGNIVSDEARAKYNAYSKQGKHGIYQGLTFWSPNINIFRDPRWGRGMETYGEDPFLTGKLGVAYIKGLQGSDSTYLKLVATAKHFAVHSGPESGRHSFNSIPSDYDYLETYTPQFKEAVISGHVYSVMCAYNRLKGMPCCGNSELSNLLRKKWDFEGYILSDCGAIKDFYAQDAHEIVNTKAEAAAIALQAGTDLNCGDSYEDLLEAVNSGYLSEKEIDVSVKRLMLARMKLGMFDPEENVPYSSLTSDIVDCKNHQLMALETARKSIVLLKNEGDVLPLNKNIKKIAVIGPNSDHLESLLGNYNGYPSSPITPLSGLKDKLPRTTISYALGCPHAEELPYMSVIPKRYLFTDTLLSEYGLKAAYYNGASFSENPVFTRVDKKVDFKWLNEGPGTGLNSDTFCVKWTGCIVPAEDGEYAIGGEGLNEISVWLDGEMLFSHESEHHPVRKYDKLELKAGHKYQIRIEYKQNQSEYALARLLWQPPMHELKEKAIEIAKGADAVVMCMGLSPLLEGEEMDVEVNGFNGGDRVNISLPKIQQELIKEIVKLGRPTILVLMNGSALAINWEKDHVPAILEAWYPGQAGGKAIADVLFGDYNPAGRLPITFYKSVNQLPDFNNYEMQGRTYRYFDKEPLYGFGYGLSYSSFEYTNLLAEENIHAGEILHVQVDVTNVSNKDGDEVVQLYISHPKTKSRVAIRSLKGFKRIHLKSGETKTISFEINPQDMAVLDEEKGYVLDGLPVEISVGGSQPGRKGMKSKQVVSTQINTRLMRDKIYVLSD